ncbi:hypothetical protein A3K87_10100 [Variovorax paradoxus]|uniref:Knr4/Smi1-like domain-containing protein n=1 Tax=Variovorax paradoxus TaxID=34073 RepID=A0AA91ICF1_VARPD|nr:SMI1/KNR4 family protein [Variovorax paradoxus]OAK66103.1 hypothetical protein A3K87_10100 [Variovorax paradoxus]
MIAQLPPEYCQHVTTNGLFEGRVVTATYEGDIILWGEEEVASANAAMEVDACAPGFIAFAGDGGGEVFMFDNAGAIYLLPMIGMEPEAAMPVAANFLELCEGLQHE